jgi:hypothetical protein
MGGTAFTVGIPVLNEEAILVPNTERLLHFLDGLGREYEILIGSNGSTDSTTLGVDLSRRFRRASFFHRWRRRPRVQGVRPPRASVPRPVDMDLSVDLEFVKTAVACSRCTTSSSARRSCGNRPARSSPARLRLVPAGDAGCSSAPYDDYSIAARRSA